MNHEELRRSLASYVLGALVAEERRELDAHLAGCQACREELASYAGLPGLLSRLDLAEVIGATLLPPPALLPSVLAAVESERAGRGRQLLRWRLVAAAGLTVAAALVGVLALPGEQPPTVSERPLVAAAGSTSRGSVSLQPRRWGTELHLRLQDLPAASGYAAYAVDLTGARTLAATWGPTPTGGAEVPGAIPLPPAALSRLVIETAGGAEILVLRT